MLEQIQGFGDSLEVSIFFCKFLKMYLLFYQVLYMSGKERKNTYNNHKNTVIEKSNNMNIYLISDDDFYNTK